MIIMQVMAAYQEPMEFESMADALISIEQLDEVLAIRTPHGEIFTDPTSQEIQDAIYSSSPDAPLSLSVYHDWERYSVQVYKES